MELKVPFVSVPKYPHKQSRPYKEKKSLNVGTEGRNYYIAFYRDATDSVQYSVSIDSAARQIQLINHSLKNNSVKFEMKSQITLQVVQSCSHCLIRIALENRKFLF